MKNKKTVWEIINLKYATIGFFTGGGAIVGFASFGYLGGLIGAILGYIVGYRLFKKFH